MFEKSALNVRRGIATMPANTIVRISDKGPP
jgi:hypothetical protein